MAFNVALSGIRAASDALDVIGNNVANSSTVGFKSSRVEFSDVYAASVLGSGAIAKGSGVQLAGINQDFSQGNITFTGNNLDLAINGKGFFRVSKEGTVSYTRSGAFKPDENGFLTNSQDQLLMGYAADADGNIFGSVGNLKLNSANINPQSTRKVVAELNLDSSSKIPTVGTFSADDPNSYNATFSTSIYDSLGNSHILNMYFIKTGNNAWDTVFKIDGQNVGGVAPAAVTEARFEVKFNGDGSLDLANSVPINIQNWSPKDGTGAANGAFGPPQSNFTLEWNNTTQHSTPTAQGAIVQDGITTGRFASVSVEKDGKISVRYTNGRTKVIGQVALANFSNPNGLSPLGDTSWAETINSGAANLGAPGSGSLGVVQSGALEDSTVALTEELVGLIVAQRNFQANAQTIRTEDAITQTIINIR